MIQKACTSLLLAGLLAGAVESLRAQDAPPPPFPPEAQIAGAAGVAIMAGPIGERIELLGFEGMHGGKVVTGAPFSAVAVQEMNQTLADGNHIVRNTETVLFRDSQGRVRKEITLPAIGPLATSGAPKSFVIINDPVAGANFVLHGDTKTAEKMVFPGGAKNAIAGKMEYHQRHLAAEGALKTEDLGTQTIAGVSAQGTRITHTIPPGQIGNEKAITVVSEQWYSNDLQMVVMSKRSDPRFGDTTYTLTNIQRQEPAAPLFAVPSDYTVTSGKNRMFVRKFNGGPDAPPPPPPDN